MNNKTGRNEPCPCGSGKKYKSCCWKQNRSTPRKINASILKSSGMTKFFPKLNPKPQSNENKEGSEEKTLED